MLVYKTKVFDKDARKAGIEDKDLWKPIRKMEKGLFYADLGGGVHKEPVGARGSHRVLIAFKPPLYVVMLIFAKSDQDNLTDAEVNALKSAARDWLKLTAREFKKLSMRAG